MAGFILRRKALLLSVASAGLILFSSVTHISAIAGISDAANAEERVFGYVYFDSSQCPDSSIRAPLSDISPPKSIFYPNNSIAKLIRGKEDDYYVEVVDIVVAAACPPDEETSTVNSTGQCADTIVIEKSMEACNATFYKTCPEVVCEDIGKNCYWGRVTGDRIPEQWERLDPEEIEGGGWADLWPYGTGTLPYLAPGFVCAILTCMLWDCGWADRWSEERKYSEKDLIFPKVIYVLASAITIVAATFAYIFLHKIRTVIADLYYNAELLMTDGQDQIEKATQQIRFAADQAMDFAYSASAEVYTSPIVRELDGLIYEQWEFYRGGYAVVGDGGWLIWDNIVSELDVYIWHLRLLQGDAAEKIRIEVRENIAGPVNALAKDLLDWAEALEDKRVLFRDLSESFYHKLFSWIGTAVLVWTLVSLFMGGVAIIFYRKVHRTRRVRMERSFYTTVKSAASLGFLTFFISGLLLIFAVVNHDACIMADSAVRNSEPILGAGAAKGVGPCLAGSYLADAWELDQFKWINEDYDGPFSSIYIDPTFDKVFELFERAQYRLNLIEEERLKPLNLVSVTYNNFISGIKYSNCPYIPIFENPFKVLVPWPNAGNRGVTTFKLASTGTTISLKREGKESMVEYMRRIYDPAGICILDGGCTLNGEEVDLNGEEVDLKTDCNGGDGCVYACKYAVDGFLEAYENLALAGWDYWGWGLDEMNEKIDDYNLLVKDSTASICPLVPVFKDSIAAQSPYPAGGGTTDYVLNATGKRGYLGLEGDETNVDYVKRISNVAGTCISKNPGCRLRGRRVGMDMTCNGGEDCKYPCARALDRRVKAYVRFMGEIESSLTVTSNLGILCPVGRQCPSEEFSKVLGDRPIARGINDFRAEVLRLIKIIQQGANELLNNATLDTLCVLDCSILAAATVPLAQGFCADLLDNMTLAAIALWSVAFFLQVAAVAAFTLCERFKKLKVVRRESDDDSSSSDSSDDTDSDDNDDSKDDSSDDSSDDD